MARAAPLSVRACHCGDCRKATGAPYSVFLEFALQTLHWEQEPSGVSCRGVTRRRFCQNCGSPVDYRDDRLPGRTYVLLGMMDEPELFEASDHAFTHEALPDVTIPEGKRRHPAFSVERP